MAKRRLTAPRDQLIRKAPLAREIARILDERGLTQTEASYVVRDAPSQLSLMVNGKLAGFSAERLIRTLTRLGRDVEITVRPARRTPGRVSLTVR